MFDELVVAKLPEELKAAVKDLLMLKEHASEFGTGTRIPELDRYIYEQIEVLQACAEQEENLKNDWDELEKFFRNTVMR